MNKETTDRKIIEIAKTVFSYCLARTNTKEEAEDLSQDILLEILRSCENIRDDKAFYGFMWAVAGNVYKNWCKKRLKNNFSELDDNLCDETYDISRQLEFQTDINLLRRELCLLNEKNRKAMILYYLNGFSVSSIAIQLHLSDSMVKYLLFKARQILKEGMNMERNYGEQSYNPKELSLLYMGEGPNHFWQITQGKKIPQNILWACYNDNLTEEEISLQIGVALPYLENDIKTLLDAGLLLRKGNRYSTNIIIITKQFKAELATKIAVYQENIANKIYKFITENENCIRSIGYYCSGMLKNTFYWQITSVILNCLFGMITESFNPTQAPVTAFGDHAYVWVTKNRITYLIIAT
ncbi:MAG: hypothetical protein A2Y17_11000 [Clostridiales bacterium GWF2_38_85]|nr:MAG: hypothetical protein A2Y17_11000 [Clostridiales bacterium GWF2_38_85]